MKAILFYKTGSIADIQVGEVASPSKLKANEVRIKFLAGSLNHLDLWVVKGLPRLKYQFPQIAGSDICGEVVESKARLFRKGQTVIAYPAESAGKNRAGKAHPENLCEDFKIRGENRAGVFADEVVIDARYLVHAPKHLSFEESASLPLVYLTAWQMITEKAALTKKNIHSHRILVHGAGSGVSQAILEILYSFGAKSVVVTSRRAEKLEHWKKRKFKGVVLTSNAAEDLKQSAGPEKFSIIFDHIGESLFEMNIRLLANAGKLIACGATSGPIAKLDLRHLYFRQLQLLGSTMGSLKHFHDVIRWVEKNKIRPQISRQFHFHQAREAYDFLESSEQAGKVVLVR